MARDKQLNLKISRELYAAFEREAHRAHLSTPTWVMLMAAQGAGETALFEQLLRVAPARPPRKKKT